MLWTGKNGLEAAVIRQNDCSESSPTECEPGLSVATGLVITLRAMADVLWKNPSRPGFSWKPSLSA
jgi:hypothetical protein